MRSGWAISQTSVHTTPMTRAAASVSSVSSTLTAILAKITRSRRGSRENVTSAERWLHSLVTSMIARIGSRNAVRYAAIATKSPSRIGSDWTRVMTSAMPTTTSMIAMIDTSSQKPARVS